MISIHGLGLLARFCPILVNFVGLHRGLQAFHP